MTQFSTAHQEAQSFLMQCEDKEVENLFELLENFLHNTDIDLPALEVLRDEAQEENRQRKNSYLEEL